MSDSFRCGYVALVGTPNTGKSTLMNALVGEKLSITAHRPQTTRHQILGIRNREDSQCIFIDTPGIHDDRSKAIHRYMNRAATSVLDDADLVCVLLDVRRIGAQDEKILRLVAKYDQLLLVLNKIDLVAREDCLPVLQRLGELLPGVEIVPVSALKRENLDTLEDLIVARLPPGRPFYASDQLTDRSMRFIAAEIVREKLFRSLDKELPYSITVNVDHYVEEPDLTRIAATIWVERKSQKAIVIGKGGRQLKKIGSQARADLEGLLQGKVYLQLWVKLREDWADDERSLAAFGYSDVEQGR
ncbi:MAG: GTPase Era [Gammaproteobacteria bacterium]|nr:GTPase Era [Gammaproteobacteria bacterium]